MISWWSVQQHAEYKLRQEDSKGDDEGDKTKYILDFVLRQKIKTHFIIKHLEDFDNSKGNSLDGRHI